MATELPLEAPEAPDTALVTSMVFAGFLLFLLLGMAEEAGPWLVARVGLAVIWNGRDCLQQVKAVYLTRVTHLLSGPRA